MTRARALARARNPLRQGVRPGVVRGDLCVEPMGRARISHTKRISTLAWELGAGKVPYYFRVPKDPPLRFVLPSLFSFAMFTLVRLENHRVYIEALPSSKMEGVRKNILPSLPIIELLLVLYWL